MSRRKQPPVRNLDEWFAMIRQLGELAGSPSIRPISGTQADHDALSRWVREAETARQAGDMLAMAYALFHAGAAHERIGSSLLVMQAETVAAARKAGASKAAAGKRTKTQRRLAEVDSRLSAGMSAKRAFAAAASALNADGDSVEPSALRRAFERRQQADRSK